jgi:polysaccharide biosynthesis/export protein
MLLIVLSTGVTGAGNLVAAEDEAGSTIGAIRHAVKLVSGQLETAAERPHELSMRPLPAYRIDPPDLLQIEMLKMVPRPPYRVAIYDVLQIQVVNALTDQPIDGFYLVDAQGTVNLGPAYGKVSVVGMTIDEVTKAVGKHLEKMLKRPEISAELSRASATQPVTGTYLVGPDGTINLRQYGTVEVMGKTIAEIQAAVEKQLAKYFQSPEVTIAVAGYNSKVYYIVTQGAGVGDGMRRVPITGHDTVLDAISQIGGLSQLSGKKIWIARPSATDCEKGTILRVDYEGILHRAATKTNYQLIPGDRIFIAEDKWISANNSIGKMTQPVERILGLIGLAAATIEQIEKILPGHEQQEEKVEYERFR